MAKTILLIESDAPFAREMSAALEARGFGVRVSADGKEGLELARDLRPDLVVLCVELPRMSGYSVCNKLKKDEALRAIPLVVISAEATPETFEQHRKLKTRAEDYLIKPFPPETLVERVGALVGLPEPAAGPDEEVVTLADVELEAGAAQDLPPLEFSSARESEEDEDLRLLDDAFDTIARGEPAPELRGAAGAPAQRPEPGEAPPPDDGALAFEDDVLEAPEAIAAHPEPAVPAASRTLVEELAADLEPLSAEVLEVLEPDTVTRLAPAPSAGLAGGAPPSPDRASTEDLLRAAGIPLLAAEPAVAPADAADAGGLRAELGDARRALVERDAETRRLREEMVRLRTATDEAALESGTRESELRAARARLEAVQGTVKKLEADLYAAREDARLAAERAASMERDLAALRSRLDESEQVASRRGAEVAEAVARAESAGRSLDELRTELSVTRSETEALRSDAERRSADLRRRLQELEAQAARHEERVVKAYQKIKTDEKLKEKTRKALTVALQLLDERLPPESGGETTAAPLPERPAS